MTNTLIMNRQRRALAQQPLVQRETWMILPPPAPRPTPGRTRTDRVCAPPVPQPLPVEHHTTWLEQQIVELCLTQFKVSVAEVLSADRHRRICQCRTAICLLLHEHAGCSMPEIGAVLGRGGHSTAHTAAGRFDQIDADVRAALAAGVAALLEQRFQTYELETDRRFIDAVKRRDALGLKTTMRTPPPPTSAVPLLPRVIKPRRPAPPTKRPPSTAWMAMGNHHQEAA